MVQRLVMWLAMQGAQVRSPDGELGSHMAGGIRAQEPQLERTPCTTMNVSVLRLGPDAAKISYLITRVGSTWQQGKDRSDIREKQ